VCSVRWPRGWELVNVAQLVAVERCSERCSGALAALVGGRVAAAH
jgi:hypothetical protein